MPVNDDPPCHTEACAIQICLSRNAYKEERCKWALGDLYQCCQEMYFNDRKDSSPSCPEFSKLQKLLRLRVVDDKKERKF